MYFCHSKNNNNMSVISSKILVPIGFSNQSLIAFDQACNFAKLNHSKIFLLSVIEERNAMHSLFLDDNSHKLKKMVLQKLTELSQEFAEKYSLEIEIMVSQGKIYNQINEVAEMIGADLIIMGTTGSHKQKKNRFMGSNAERVIRLAKCPVMTIKGATIKGACRNIILPLDLEKETKEKVTYAIKYSRQWNATIHLISVVLRDNPIVRNKLVRNLKQVESFIKDADISCTSILLEGDKKQNLGDFIFDYEKKFDDDVIIIMTKKEELLLSKNISVTARYIINNSPVPVINIRPKERKHLTS